MTHHPAPIFEILMRLRAKNQRGGLQINLPIYNNLSIHYHLNSIYHHDPGAIIKAL